MSPRLRELHYSVSMSHFLGARSEVGTIERMKRTLRKFVARSSSKIATLSSREELTMLWLDDQFGQEFYDQLPAFANSLTHLGLHKVQKNELQFELQLSFDFIGKLPHLSNLTLYQNWSLSSLTSLVRWSSKLEGGSSSIKKQSVSDY